MDISRAEWKRSLLEAIIFLVVGLLAGLLAAYLAPQTSGEAFDVLRDTVAPLMKLSGIELFGLILLNNAVKAYLAMALGLGLGIYSAFFLIVNGFVLGNVMNIIAAETGFLFVFASILPHGIIEIPAILAAASLGLIMGRCGLKRLRGKNCDIKPLWKKSNKIFFTYILPALIAASFVEVFLTPVIAGIV